MRPEKSICGRGPPDPVAGGSPKSNPRLSAFSLKFRPFGPQECPSEDIPGCAYDDDLWLR